MTPARQARTERMRGYFALQLSVARRMSELTGAPTAESVLRYTNFHRRFGLGRCTADPHPDWLPYAQALATAGADLDAQLEVTVRAFLGMPEEGGHEAGRASFGCFACDTPKPDGSVQIHFLNLDTDEVGGPLSSAKLDRRRGEMAAMIAWLREAHPEATHIRGRSWLYNLPAYRRVFPPEYGGGSVALDEQTTLHGNSLWGQTIDSWERVKPDAAAALTANLPAMDPAAPWRVFPQPVRSALTPIPAFERFYGLGA